MRKIPDLFKIAKYVFSNLISKNLFKTVFYYYM